MKFLRILMFSLVLPARIQAGEFKEWVGRSTGEYLACTTLERTRDGPHTFELCSRMSGMVGIVLEERDGFLRVRFESYTTSVVLWIQKEGMRR